MYDHMQDVEALQVLERRLKGDPDCDAAMAHIQAAITVLWDIGDPEGAAERIKEQGYLTTARCNTCGKVMSGAVFCGPCRRRQTGGKA